MSGEPASQRNNFVRPSGVLRLTHWRSPSMATCKWLSRMARRPSKGRRVEFFFFDESPRHDFPHLECVVVQSKLQAFAHQTGLGGGDADALVSMIGHPPTALFWDLKQSRQGGPQGFLGASNARGNHGSGGGNGRCFRREQG